MRILPLFAHNPSAWTGAGNHTYLVIAGGDAVLIDAGVGHPEHLASLDEALRREGGGQAAAALGRVLVTHGHLDHASGAPVIAAAHPRAVFRKYPWPPLDSRYPVAWEPLAGGSVEEVGPHRLTTIRTPGHSPDHVCFFESREGVLFGGDLVLKGSTVVILASSGGSLASYLESLRLVIDLAPRRILPGHGEAIEDPVPLLESYIAHRLMRERQIVDLVSAGPRSADEVVARLYDGLAPGLTDAARESVLAHLHKLRDEGVVVVHTDVGGLDTWSLA